MKCIFLFPSSTELSNINHHNNTRALIISSCIFAEDECSQTVCRSIIDIIKDKADLPDQRRTFHKAKYGGVDEIPSLTSMELTMLKGAMITSDTCNGARLSSTIVQAEVEEVIKTQAYLECDHYMVSVVRMDCYHHLRKYCLAWCS